MITSTDAPYNICIIPPREEAGVASDCDSEKSDDDNEGNLYHLPRRILNAQSYIEDQNDDNDKAGDNGDHEGPSNQTLNHSTPKIWSKAAVA